MSAHKRIIQIALPATLYERVEALASQTERSVESVLVETVAQRFDTPEDADLERFSMLSDHQLWAIVQQQLDNDERARMWTLIEASKERELTDTEEAELDAIQVRADEQLYERSTALVVLQKRGHEIGPYFL